MAEYVDPRVAVARVLDEAANTNIDTRGLYVTSERNRSWPMVRAGIVRCTRCELRSRCGHATPHDNPIDADIAVIGAGPGVVDHDKRRPFLDPPSKLLRACMNAARIDLARVAFGNTVACKPTDTTGALITPALSDRKACRRHLLDWLGPIPAVLLVGSVGMSPWRADLTVQGTVGAVGLWTVNGQTKLTMVVRNPSGILGAPNAHELKNELVQDLSRFARVASMVRRGESIVNKFGHWCVECSNGDVAYVDPDGMGWCERHARMEGERGAKARKAGVLRWQEARVMWDKVKINDHPALPFDLPVE